MVDRQDIDALLIGSLYGELSSTDEARLQAHLESHPADRTALDDLTRARQVVRESRILQVQLEPPQAVSALLLQEAARRAPRVPARGEGWFQRFLRSFVAHPAMAAAAMLVVVMGVASTLYLRKGDDHLATGTAHQDEAEVSSVAPAMSATPDESRSAPAVTLTADGVPEAVEQTALAGKNQGSAYRVGLADAENGVDKDASGKRQQEQPDTRKPTAPALDQPTVAAKPTKKARPEAPKTEPTAPVKPDPELRRSAGPNRVLEVSTPERAPMDLAEDAVASKLKVSDKASKAGADRKPSAGDRTIARDEGASAPTGAPASVAPPGGTRGAKQSAPMPSPRPPTTGAQSGATPVDARTDQKGRVTTSLPPPPPPAPAPALEPEPSQQAKQDVAKESNEKRPAQAPAERLRDPRTIELSWARDQHAQVIVQVRAGNCANAARLAMSLSTRAPAYYEQNVQSDRQVKDCVAYINAARDRDERERAQRVRASKRATDEPAKAKPSKK